MGRLRELNVPLVATEEPVDTLMGRMGSFNEVAARSILLLELRPPRGVRPEGFEYGSTRPGFYFAMQGMNCPFLCEYCYLWANSLGVKPLVVYSGLDEVFRRIGELQSQSSYPLTFNFGEETDSLAIEHITGIACEVISFFSKSNSFLELRTKAGFVRDLIDCEHNGRTTIGLSVNPDKYAAMTDHGAPGVGERLEAGREYSRAGYGVALKVEPGILLPGWEDAYGAFVRGLSSCGFVPVHVSLGCFRYKPELGEAMSSRYKVGAELIMRAQVEYVPNRFSYPDDLRIRFYSFMIDALRALWPHLPVYLSMESDAVCRVLGAEPWVESRPIYSLDEAMAFVSE